MQDGALLFGLIAAMAATFKVAEKLLEMLSAWWTIKKNVGESNGKTNGKILTPLIVQLDPQASSAIAQLLEKVTRVHEIVDAKDNDGVHLIYFPRSFERNMSDKLCEIHQDISRITRSK